MATGYFNGNIISNLFFNGTEAVLAYFNGGLWFEKVGVYAKLYDTNSDGIGDTLVFFNKPSSLYSTGTLINRYNNKNMQNFTGTASMTSTGYASNPTPWSADAANITKVVFNTAVYPTNISGWFANFTNLTTVTNASNLKMSNVTNASWAWAGDAALTSLAVSSWDMSKVTTARGMFSNCQNITSLSVGSWTTTNLTDMAYMFYQCKELTSLDWSTWTSSKLTDISYACGKTTKLAKIYVSSSWAVPSGATVTNTFQSNTALKDVYGNYAMGSGTYARIGKPDVIGLLTQKGYSISFTSPMEICDASGYNMAGSTHPYIWKIEVPSDGITMATFRNRVTLPSGATVSYIGRNGSTKSTSSLCGTGDKFVVTYNGVTYTHILAVRGDLDGSGTVTASDMSTANQWVNGSVTLTGADKLAADADYNHNKSSNDVTVITNIILDG